MVGTSRTRRAVAAIGLVGLVAICSAPAAAAHPAKHKHGETNHTFAGYDVEAPKTHIKSATDTFVIPSITCKKNYSGVGPAVIINSTVDKKTNTYSSSGAGVGVACQHKQPVYQSIIEVDSHFYDDQPLLAAGDRVTINALMSKKKVVVTLDDVTSNTTFTHSAKGVLGASVVLGSATLVINKHSVGLDPFNKIKITDAKVNGKSLKAEKAVKVTWVHKKHVLVTASKLHQGTAFTLTFKRSA
jgi:hypothetical protein